MEVNGPIQAPLSLPTG